jgi:hypothetical protein
MSVAALAPSDLGEDHPARVPAQVSGGRPYEVDRSQQLTRPDGEIVGLPVGHQHHGTQAGDGGGQRHQRVAFVGAAPVPQEHDRCAP